MLCIKTFFNQVVFVSSY